MPIHDWTSVEAGIFHAFHHDWITEISRALNRGLLPAEYYALPEQIAGDFGPDVLTLNMTPAPAQPSPSGDIAKAVVIRHVSNHRIVAMIEIVSPGNKGSQTALNVFVRKAQEALAAGVHLSLVDLFPPGPRDPLGIHQAVWGEDPAALPEGKSLTCVAYITGTGADAFIDFLSVGQPLPQMPLFLTADVYVAVPLDASYQLAWESMPKYWRGVLEGNQA